MVKLQRSISYKYKYKDGRLTEHYRTYLIIPGGIVEKLGWSKGEELEFEVEDGSLLIKPKRAILRKQLVV